MIEYPSRLTLANLPTRIEKMERFSEEIGCNTYVKRDDLTGNEISGNKVRKLEFAVQEALDTGAKVLITCGGIQSNHCRATAAVAAKLGLKSCLVLRSDTPTPEVDGNYFIDKLLGADIQIVTSDEYRLQRREIMADLAETYRKKGFEAYVIPEGASNGIGTFGYIACMEEIIAQEKEMGVVFDTIIDAVGSGGTFAGLCMANVLLQTNRRMVGFNVCNSAAYFKHRVCELVAEAAVYLKVDVPLSPEKIEIIDGYVGRGYALSRKEELDFLAHIAQLEGLILDPVYTGKCLYGFSQEAKKGLFKSSKNVLFVHTGGLFGLFPKKGKFNY